MHLESLQNNWAEYNELTVFVIKTTTLIANYKICDGIYLEGGEHKANLKEQAKPVYCDVKSENTTTCVVHSR